MNQNTLIALAIVFGSILVALSVIMTGSVKVPFLENLYADKEGEISTVRRADAENRFVYGNEKAETTIVEFSDYECPYCSVLHPTLKKIVDESEDTINWEYRHLPLPIHKNAQLAAVLGECVGELAGNEAFWLYSDSLFTNQKNITSNFLSETALTQNIAPEELEACVNEGSAVEQVASDMATAQALGGSGTPFSVIVFKDGTTKNISGALPYESWAQTLGLY